MNSTLNFCCRKSAKTLQIRIKLTKIIHDEKRSVPPSVNTCLDYLAVLHGKGGVLGSISL